MSKAVDSFPMIARCFERQWEGLPEGARKCLIENPASVFCWLEPRDREFPIWYVIHIVQDLSLTLLSIKEDILSDDW